MELRSQDKRYAAQQHTAQGLQQQAEPPKRGAQESPRPSRQQSGAQSSGWRSLAAAGKRKKGGMFEVFREEESCY